MQAVLKITRPNGRVELREAEGTIEGVHECAQRIAEEEAGDKYETATLVEICWCGPAFRRIKPQEPKSADPVKTVPVTIEHDGIRGAVRKTFDNAIEATKHYVDMLSQGRKPRVHSASREAIVHVLNAGMMVTR